MSETLAVFQPAMFWLNADVSNICEPHHSMDASKRQTSPIWAEACGPAQRSHAAAAKRTSLEARSAAKARYARMAACHGKERTAYIAETLAVFQPAMFWLNADAK
jgi:hypothetical protein